MTPEEVAEALRDVREHIKRISADDAARRTPCPTCGFSTRSLERHAELHGREPSPLTSDYI